MCSTYTTQSEYISLCTVHVYTGISHFLNSGINIGIKLSNPIKISLQRYSTFHLAAGIWNKLTSGFLCSIHNSYMSHCCNFQVRIKLISCRNSIFTQIDLTGVYCDWLTRVRDSSSINFIDLQMCFSTMKPNNDIVYLHVHEPELKPLTVWTTHYYERENHNENSIILHFIHLTSEPSLVSST